MDILGKCTLSFFLSEAPNWFYFTCGFVKEEKKLQISLCSICLVWSKIPRKMYSFQQRHFLGSVVLSEALGSEGKFVLVAAYFHGLSLTWLEAFGHYWERLERKEGQVVSWEKIRENYYKICAVKWENQHLLAVCFLSGFFFWNCKKCYEQGFGLVVILVGKRDEDEGGSFGSMSRRWVLTTEAVTAMPFSVVASTLWKIN